MIPPSNEGREGKMFQKSYFCESAGSLHLRAFLSHNLHPLTFSDESMNTFYAYKIRINIMLHSIFAKFRKAQV